MEKIALIGIAVITVISGAVVYTLHKEWIARMKKIFNRREYY